MRDDLVLNLSDPRAADPRLTGGKGSSLARAVAAGFPVPEGFVVTAEAYRLFAGKVDATAAPDAVRATLEARTLPDGIRAEVAQVAGVYAAMGTAPGTGALFAVRSSGTMEDLADAAFAGQHDTYLGVPLDGVPDAVARCLASLWTGRAHAYRGGRGLDHAEAAMAVVVQRMVDADAAGVAFTLDPVTGASDAVSVEAAWGLGETVVSGDGETDRWSVPRDGSPARTLGIGDKRHALRLSPTGTDTVDTGGMAGEPCLSPAEVAAVAALALKAEAAAGFPQDVEWAVSGGKAYLLQSRPVTAFPERWTRDESAERFPNPVTPLTWNLVETGFHEALRHSFGLMGLPAFGGRWFALMPNDYVYGNQAAVDAYMGRPPAAPRDMDAVRLAIPVLRERFSWLVELPARWALDLDGYLIRLGALSKGPAGPSLRDAWEHLLAVNEAGRTYFRSNIAISIAHSFLDKGLAHAVHLAVGPGRAPAILSALRGLVETKTTLINGELAELAAMAATDAPLAAWLRGRRPGTVPPAGTGGETFRARMERFLSDHGHRELDFDPYAGNWADAPGFAYDAVALAASAPAAGSPRDRLREARMAAGAAEDELLAAVPADVRHLYRELVRLSRAYESLDDLEHYETARLTVPMRAAVRRIAELLGPEVCPDALDPFLATPATLGRACTAPSPANLAALRDEVAANRLAHHAARAADPEWEFGKGAGAARADLSGVPGSPGLAEGPVRIVRGTDDFASFPRGAILVARTTNPSWTPLFHAAAGVVAESGGALSHGAVTAREMGLPAVMAVRGVLTDLRDGDVVRIDGTAGTVEVVSRAA